MLAPKEIFSVEDHELPRTVRAPLIIVSLVSIWMGMGSLHALHVPVALSPFDWLRPLPAFRSIGVRPHYYAEDQEDAIVMLLDLG